jgi:hypothetical protein
MILNETGIPQKYATPSSRRNQMITDDARMILSAIGMPRKQQADICIYTLLALARVSNNTSWTSATNEFMRIHDVIMYLREKFDICYAENSHEIFRKQAMHPFRMAEIIEDNGKAPSSPHYRYRLTSEMLALIQSFETPKWDAKLMKFGQNRYQER